MYAITVATSSTQSPTIYLDENVQGIVNSTHASKVITEWLKDLGITAQVSAEWVPGTAEAWAAGYSDALRASLS